MRKMQGVLALVALFVGLAQSWDIAVTSGDRLEFYTDDIKTDTVRFVSQNLTAIAYDEVDNMLLYVDKQTDNDGICGYNISSVEYKCYIERNGRNIQGLAFDPVTEKLFFTDAKERSINWISLKPGTEKNVKVNLLINMAAGIPTDIAVDSCREYIYWINTHLTPSTIERARFDGSDREVVFSSYKWDLHSLAISQQTQKIYWFMPKSKLTRYLYSADLNGRNKNILMELDSDLHDKTFTHPNKLTISKEFLFATSWSYGSVEVWKFPKPRIDCDYKYKSEETVYLDTESVVGIAAKYKISEQTQGVQDCEDVTDLVENKYNMIDDSYKIAREYAEPFCDKGISTATISLTTIPPSLTTTPPPLTTTPPPLTTTPPPLTTISPLLNTTTIN